ncbi:MAG: outer membrane beta-barrel protein [Taibaiella sp.]|nr:outer membrane beta-barrel protein [Taibaiella sp.]
MKRFMLCFGLGLTLAALANTAQAQDSCVSHSKKDWVVGYQIGGQLLTSKQMPQGRYAFTTGVYGKKYFGQNLSVEFDFIAATSKSYYNGVTITSKGTGNIYNISVPVTIQYNFRATKKLRPSIGAGVAYNVYQEKYSEYNFTDGAARNITTIHTSTPFASFVITQGITYDISPRIQIKQSLHFMPATVNSHSLLGATVGIGFKL